MLYLILGNDFKKKGAQIKQLSVGKSCVDIVASEFSENILDEYIASRDLFGGGSAVVLDGVFGDKEHQACIIENIKQMAGSDTIFIFTEEKLLKKIQDKVAKYCDGVFVFEQKETRVYQNEFSIFALADAVGARDKKQAWILLQEALEKDIAPENIYGTLFWQIKTLAIVEASEQENIQLQKLGLKPFVLSKAQRYLKKYQPGEVMNILRSLIDIYHRARMGKEEFSIGLERLVLSL